MHFYLSQNTCSVESWLSAQSFCHSVGGDLPVLRNWEYMDHINSIAKPWPVYIGLIEVNLRSSFSYIAAVTS